jgi:flagellar motor component MotA
MDSYWMSEFNNEDELSFGMEDNDENDFYCPYMNGSECALIIKGWQPQEICESLECEQLKLLRRNKHHEAA